MIEVILEEDSFKHLRDRVAVADDEADSFPLAITLDPSHAKNLQDGLTGALGSLVDQPAKVAGDAVAQMVRERDKGALQRLGELVAFEVAKL